MLLCIGSLAAIRCEEVVPMAIRASKRTGAAYCIGMLALDSKFDCQSHACVLFSTLGPTSLHVLGLQSECVAPHNAQSVKRPYPDSTLHPCNIRNGRRMINTATQSVLPSVTPARRSCPKHRRNSQPKRASISSYVGGLCKYSATGTRTRVARVRAEYPNQLDYSGVVRLHGRKSSSNLRRYP